jgi:GDPmannose 4,6-dehydratase
MSKKALITGITGQDGSYLADHLLTLGYEVHGMVRRSSTETHSRIKHLEGKITLHQGDILDIVSLIATIEKSEPDEIYNLAAQSFVPTSWEQPVLTGEYTGLGVTRMLEALRNVNSKIKFYQASSSEMFGKVLETPQSEETPFYPRSPYGVAKAYGHFITVNYRESYDLYACSGILFNHESPRRGLEFVTRKISYNVALIKKGLKDKIGMGNIDAKRDWGYAGDYVKMMHLMLQQDKADDFVIASGETHTVEEFLDIAFSYVGLNFKDHVYTDPRYVRPAEVDVLLGDCRKAKAQLGWETEVGFEDLVRMMVESDLKWVTDGA